LLTLLLLLLLLTLALLALQLALLLLALLLLHPQLWKCSRPCLPRQSRLHAL
jgi:hypothetical protein